MSEKSSLPTLIHFGRQLSPFAALLAEVGRSNGGISSLFDENFGMGGDVQWLTPKVDIAETDEAVEITMDLPGIKDEDLEVTLTDDVLLIQGNHSEERKESEKNYHIVERRLGSFRRHIPLGFTVEPDKVEAHFDSGVLTVEVHKPEIEKPVAKKIKVAKSKASKKKT